MFMPEWYVGRQLDAAYGVTTVARPRADLDVETGAVQAAAYVAVSRTVPAD